MEQQQHMQILHFETPASTHRELGLDVLGFGAIEAKNESTTARILESYAAVFVHSGTGWLDTAATGRLPVRAGSLFWLFPGLAHSYAPDTAGWSEQW
jgi:hypothetical protein